MAAVQKKQTSTNGLSRWERMRLPLVQEWGGVDDDVIERGVEMEEQLQSVKVEQCTTKTASTAFSVDKVAPCTTPLPRSSYVKSTAGRINQKLECCFYGGDNMVSNDNLHGLVSAVHTAYQCHYPLVLSPDMIWLCIMQGLSQHINQNAEELREKFVKHEGKKEIEIRRDDFVKGLATNPWPEAFGEFSGKIKDEIGEKTYNLITPDFSTTGPLEKAVTDIVLMEAMQKYFSYSMRTCCGIPSITLEGSKEDWLAIREKTAQLKQYDLEWWIENLLPILDEFVDASSGEIDTSFWSNIYKLCGMSGGPFISGWILTLFPYIEDWDKTLRRNTSTSDWLPDRHPVGVTTDAFPSGLSKAPFVWKYFEERFKMKFIGGFMGVSQDPETLSLRPELGWAVVEESEVMCG